MSKSIELLIKLHDPKCVSIETAGRGGVALLYKEQIICAFAQAESKYMLGYHLLMSKYRQQTYADSLNRVNITYFDSYFNTGELPLN